MYNGVIYLLRTISDINCENIYIGSTKNIKRRFSAHKSSILSNKTKDSTTKKTKYFREQDDPIIYEILEESEFNTKSDLLFKEAYYINVINPLLNTILPAQSIEERNEQRKTRHRLYYIKNKEYLLNKSNLYNKNKKKLISCDDDDVIS